MFDYDRFVRIGVIYFVYEFEKLLINIWFCALLVFSELIWDK